MTPHFTRRSLLARLGVGLLASWVLLGQASAATAALPSLSSPDQHLRVQLSLDAQHGLRYSVSREGRTVLLPSRLGLQLEGADLASQLQFESAGAVQAIDESYEMQTGKQRLIRHRAQEQWLTFCNPQQQCLQLGLRVANDGVALRYRTRTGLPHHRLVQELTSFRLPVGARAWLQPMSVAQTGWKRTNPSYEEHYLLDQPVGTPSPSPAGWVFPALFRSGSTWLAISEAGMDGHYHASRLQAGSAGGEYRLGQPMDAERLPGGALLAEADGELRSPWRLIALGSLKTLMESTLGTDLAEPAIAFDPALVRPGLASWSWALLKDDATVLEVQRRFIDHAAEMHWDYTLIDADWDRKIGEAGIRQLVAQAAAKNVGILLWYNSSGPWNDTEYSPKSRLLTHAQRLAEFSRLREWGVKGIKVDFFAGDGQSVIAYYLDILQDAAAQGLLVNFHGATLPRGWARTYPNLMTMEAVKGLEFTTFTQADQDRVPSHAAMLPFARNLFDPMDFTPMVLGEIPNIRRATRNGFELAETVLFLSGIQHIAETPEGMAKAPAFAKQFLQHLPRRWDETRFLAGEPGRHVAIARRAGANWYVAGLNAGQKPLTLTLDLRFLGARAGQLIRDGAGARELVQQPWSAGSAQRLTLQPKGGFVAVFREDEQPAPVH